MTRTRSAHVVAWISCGFATVTAGTSAVATDLVVDSSVLFSALDGGASDDDGLVDGFLTLNGLTLTERGEIVLDVPFAEFHVLGEVRLEGRSAIHPPEDLPPAVGPTLTIFSGRSILMLGASTIAADGTEAGGTVLLCASEDIDLRGKTATIASSGLGPNGVGGSIVLQGGARIKLNSSAVRIMANGAVGGNVTLISCGEDVIDGLENEDGEVAAGLAILIKGQIQAVGSDGSGGSVDIFSRQGGIEFRGKPRSLSVGESFSPRQGGIRGRLRSFIDASGSTDDGTIMLTAATSVKPDPPRTKPAAAVTTDSPTEETCNCSLFGPLLLTIQSPENRSVTADSLVDVTGKASGAALVTVNGVEATVVAGTFAALDVALAEGTNVLVATTENEVGDTASDTVSVRRDTTPPLVVIETPRGGDRLVTETVTVAGTVNDIIPGATTNADDVTVTVNGLPAAVNNRTFILPDLRLELGLNTIVATAVDRVGNTNTTSIQVTREPDLAGIQIVITGGNAQRGPINSLLPFPVSVRLQDADEFPFPNRPVTFEVSRGDGRLDDPLDNLRLITLLTDGAGNAALDFTLGSRTGEGFHRVRVTTPGSLTFAEFCATAEPAAPVNIAINAMPPGQGIAGQSLPTPLSVIVTDEGGNSAPGVAVTFSVEFGGGNFGGAGSVVSLTNPDGVAEAEWTLGPNPGVANNEVTATFDGNPGFPVTFIVSGIVTGPVEDTTVSAIVQDSTGNPIEGVQAVLRGTALEAFTGPDGKFIITDVPPGGHRVGVLGSAADDPENGIFFPDIDFAIEAISGVDNMLDPPIVILPFLDVAGAKLVGGDEDVILTMADTAGFSVKVFARSTFKRDPVTGELVQESLVMSSSQVKFDKMPMPPPQGSTPLVVGTLQPPGVIFDPPARVTYPNVGGLAPGDVADMFAFHHDIGQFVNIGPGTVSEDGSVVVSDPGFGIVQSGWHCLIRIPGDGAKCANKCKGKLEWRIFKADGSLGPPKTKGPVELCVGQSAEITVKFQPPGGTFDSMNWSGGSPQVTRSAESAIGTTAKVTLQASSTTGTTTVTSPKYRIKVTGKPDKTCEAVIEVKVVEFPTDVSFVLSDQTGVSEPNGATAVLVTIGGKPFANVRGINPARYTPKIKITAPDNARAQEFEVGLIQNVLGVTRVYDYSSGAQVRNVLPFVPLKDGAPPTSGAFDDVFAENGSGHPNILKSFTASGDEVRLVLPDTPGGGAFLSLLDDPSCGPPLAGATLNKLVLNDEFRTWIGVRHKPSGCVKTLHHIDWNTDWDATVAIAGGTASITLTKKGIDVTTANGDGSPQYVRGAPVGGDLLTRECR